jgi:DNA-directed RNA polymerase specialized sigma subunit
MQKWEEIEQKKEYLKGYIKAKNRETLIKDQIQQLRLGMMLPALQGDGMPRDSSQKDLSDCYAKIESLMEELEKEWVESVIRYERIRKAINKMNDEQEKEALTRYYLLRENNKAIQRKMGVSKAKLYRIYDSALENFEIL